MAFYLEDSGNFRSFARSPQTQERIKQELVRQALADGVKYCEKVGIDSAVLQTNSPESSDSGLLCNGIGTLTRLMVKAKKEPKLPGIDFTDQRKPTKRMARQVFYTRDIVNKQPLYRDRLSHA